MQAHTIEAGGIPLRVYTDGPEDGEPIVFLHGFPEPSLLCWSAQLPYFAQRGYRVITLDQRGYGESAKPARVVDYRLERLAGDVVEVVRKLGYESANVVGHDWGAAVTWQLADQHPNVTKRVVILNVPHGVAFKRTLARRPAQLARSWYIFFFQLPWLPEFLLSRQGYRWLRNSMSRSAAAGTFTGADFERYVDAWSAPGALRSMINWYRGFVRHPVSLDPARKIKPPLLLIWGDRDTFLLPEMAELSLEMCERGELMHLPDASHWVQHEAATQVNTAIERFIKTR